MDGARGVAIENRCGTLGPVVLWVVEDQKAAEKVPGPMSIPVVRWIGGDRKI